MRNVEFRIQWQDIFPKSAIHNRKFRIKENHWMRRLIRHRHLTPAGLIALIVVFAWTFLSHRGVGAARHALRLAGAPRRRAAPARRA